MTALLLLAAKLAWAGAADWMPSVAVSGTHGVPADKCESSVKVSAPATQAAQPVAPTETMTDADAAGMVQVDTGAEATNTQLPAGWRERLQLGAPFDVAAVPIEALRGRPEDLARVRAVLDLAARRERVVRVSFWGASHVAGEYLTGELRRQLQDRYGDAGHGFVMPAAPWRGYRASDVNLCSGGEWASDWVGRRDGRADGLYGVAGMSVEAASAASTGWVQTTSSNPHGQRVSRFEVMFLRQPGGGTLQAAVDDAPPVAIATAGASGPGGVVLRVEDGPHRLRLNPQGDGPVRLFGVNLEREGPGVVVDAMGISGRTASTWLDWNPELVRAYVQRRPPDLAVLAYGTNEANERRLTVERYRETLRKVLGRVRELMPDTACVLVGPSDRAKKVKGSLFVVWGPTEGIAAVQREVGPEFGCATWDLQAAMGGPGSMLRWRAADLAAADFIHLSAKGYQEIARRFLAAWDGAGGR